MQGPGPVGKHAGRDGWRVPSSFKVFFFFQILERGKLFSYLSRVFVAERDLFLAHSLQLAAEGPGAGGGNVVAVVGLT